MHFSFLGSPFLTYTLAAILVATIMCLWIYCCHTYWGLIVPDQYHSKTVSTNYTAVDIAHHYFMYRKKSSNIIVQNYTRFLKPFANLKYSTSNRKYVFRINQPLAHQPSPKLTGLDLDFVLGRAFLAMKKQNKDYKYSWYHLVSQVMPIAAILAFAFFLAIDLVLNSLYLSNKHLVNSIAFLHKFLSFMRTETGRTRA